MGVAALSFFLDVRHFAIRGELAIAADHASARESCKAEEPYEAHNVLLPAHSCKQRARPSASRTADTYSDARGDSGQDYVASARYCP